MARRYNPHTAKWESIDLSKGPQKPDPAPPPVQAAPPPPPAKDVVVEEAMPVAEEASVPEDVVVEESAPAPTVTLAPSKPKSGR